MSGRSYISAEITMIVICVLLEFASKVHTEFALGNRVETLDVSINETVTKMEGDLAIDGNILFATDNEVSRDGGVLYTTNGQKAHRLQTFSVECMNETVDGCVSMENEFINDFIQLSTTEIAFVSSKPVDYVGYPGSYRSDTCVRLLNRTSMMTSPYFYYIRCDPMPREYIDKSQFLSTHMILADQRHSGFIFTYIGKNGNYTNNLRIYDLGKRELNGSFDFDGYQYESQRNDSRVYKDLPMKLKSPSQSRYHNLNRVSTFTQDDSYLFAVLQSKIYKGLLPTTSDFYSNQTFIIIFHLFSGSSTPSRFLNAGPFHSAAYNDPQAMIKINSSAYVVADSYGSRLRLLDLKTNLASPLCITGGPGTSLSTCLIVKPWTLMLWNDSLYIGSYRGISRVFQADAVSENQERSLEIGISIGTVSLLVIVIGLAVKLSRKRACYSITKRCERASQRHKNYADRKEITARSLPEAPDTPGNEHDDSVYEMAETVQEDEYDMIGDQYYSTVDTGAIHPVETEEHKVVTASIQSNCVSRKPENMKAYADINTLIPPDLYTSQIDDDMKASIQTQSTGDDESKGDCGYLKPKGRVINHIYINDS